jgi:hypothetical protein
MRLLKRGAHFHPTIGSVTPNGFMIGHPLSLSHDALRFNLLLLSQQKLGRKVTLLLPIQKIDQDKGYSPSPSSISNFYDQNSFFFLQSFLGLESFLSHLCIFFLHRSPSVHHALFLSSLDKIACGVNPPVCGQVRKPYQWAFFPIPH